MIHTSTDTMICKIINEPLTWVLEVDGQTIPFSLASNADYFEKHYEGLGYHVIRETKGKILESWVESSYQGDAHIFPLLDYKIVKEFGMQGNQVWISWQEFGTHKSVMSWVILESGHAVGFNENVSKGWSYPVKKLTDEQAEKYMKATDNHDTYHDIL